MIKLSDRTQQLIDAIFPDEVKEKAIHHIQYECAQNLPFMDEATPEDLERIRFAVIKISDRNIDELVRAISLASVDWRDVLVEADFANDIAVHEKWADGVLGRV